MVLIRHSNLFVYDRWSSGDEEGGDVLEVVQEDRGRGEVGIENSGEAGNFSKSGTMTYI